MRHLRWLQILAAIMKRFESCGSAQQPKNEQIATFKVVYAQRNPPLIRAAAFLSLIFLFIQLYLRLMTLPVFNFLNDNRKFK